MTDHLTYTDAVLNLQRYLRRVSDNGNAVPIDGIYDRDTRNAVILFQRNNGIEATGIVDKETWDAIYVEYERNVMENDKRVYIDLFPSNPENYATEIGERSSFVSIVQFILDELRVSYDTLPKVTKSGIYDEDTANAVREIQRIHNFSVTGKLDRRTWNAISDAYNRYA